MKIFPSTHQIKSVTDSHIDLDLNVPLAYIEVDYTKYDIQKKVEEQFSKDIKREILFNHKFDRANVKLFNKFNEAVDTDNLLTRIGDSYYYRPKDMITFKPQMFDYNVTIKRKLDYKISNTYNINIACIDDPDSLDLSQRIASGFSNPSAREIVPPNISINHDRIDAQAFSDMDSETCDIVIIESPDGKYYDDSSKNPILIDKESFFNNNMAIWLASDFNRQYPHDNINGGIDFEITKPILNMKTIISSDSYFDFNSLPYNPNVLYHNIFTTNKMPVVIIEHIGRGYEIISTSDILKDISTNIYLMYECILYCYLNSYKKTKNLSQWISSSVPDYQIESGRLVKKKYFVSDIDIYKHFNLKSSEMDLYAVNIQDSSSNAITESKVQDLYVASSLVNFVGMSGGKLLFNQNIARNSVYNLEPEKPIGWVSLYDGNNIVYLKELHYIVETDLNSKLFTITNEYDLNVKILAFKSTSLGIDATIPTDLVIPFIKTDVNSTERIREAEYLFYINLNNQTVNFVFSEDYTKDMGVKLFSIKVGQTPDSINITDMRQLGGGLIEGAEENYNLMDIGHINGRPYRKAGTLVFTLPTKYRKYEDIILKAINKYISASDIPVILFEDNN